MLKVLNHCPNLHGSSFVIFLDQSKKTSGRKNGFLVACEILRLFLKALPPDAK